MLGKLINHGNYLLSQLRTITTGKKRSSKWNALGKKFLEENPLCAVCGTHKRLQVHHIKPFHLFPELELEPTNLVTLCMDKYECHLLIGHGGSFKNYNSNLMKDIITIKADFSQFKKVAAEAKSRKLTK